MNNLTTRVLVFFYIFSLVRSQNSTLPPYLISTINNDQCNQDLTPGQAINIVWSMSNANVAGNDYCYIAVRSLLNLYTDDAYAVDAHVQCGAGSANLVIPESPHNAALTYNGTLFTVQLITPYGISSYTCTFRIHPKGWMVLSFSDIMSIAGVATSVLSLGLTALFWILDLRRKKKRESSSK